MSGNGALISIVIAMTISQIWEQIEAWYAQNAPDEQVLNDGASDEQIAEVESVLGLELPGEIKESLRRHDGTSEDGWATGTLNSCEDIIFNTNIWREIVAKDDLDDYVSDSPELKPGWWGPKRVMLDRDGAGNGTALDLDPSEQGRVGQLIDMDHEVGPSLSYDSYLEYLTECLEELQKGEWADGYFEPAY